MTESPLPRFVLGLVSLVLTVALVSVGLQAAAGTFADTYDLIAPFNRVGQGVDQYSTVKVRGVTVGSVAGVDLRPDGTVEITLRLDAEYPIAHTASARIEPLSVFGPKAIVIEPGTAEVTGPFLVDGDQLETGEVGSELTEIAAILGEWLDAVDPQDAMTVLRTTAEALDGQGDRLASGLDRASELASIGARRRAEIRQILAGMAQLADVLENRGDDLIGIADDTAALLGEIAPRGEQLDALLRSVSDFSGQAADLLEGHHLAIADVIDGLPYITRGISRNIDDFDDFLLAFQELFATLGTNLFRDGPDGTQLAVLKGAIPADVCDFILGLPACGGP